MAKRGGDSYGCPMDKTILKWTSKVQYRKGTPYLSLIKHLGQEHILSKGNDILCKLV